MKKLLIGLLVLTSASAFADNEFSAFEKRIAEIKNETHKVYLLKRYREARKGFKEWKKVTPNSDEIILELKQLKNDLHTPGTREHTSFLDALKGCKENPGACRQNLKSLFASISAHRLAFNPRSSNFALIQSAHAMSPGILTCGGDEEPFAGHFAVAGSSLCDRFFIGPGLYFAVGEETYSLCADTDKRGNNVGVFAKAGALLIGVETALTFGANGACLEIGYNYGSLGAAAGIVISNTRGWDKVF